MRAPVQKKRPRSNNGARSQTPGDPQATGLPTRPLPTGPQQAAGTGAPVPVAPTAPAPVAVAPTAPVPVPVAVAPAAPTPPTAVTPAPAPAPAAAPAPAGRAKRVRSRLVAGVALVGLTVLAAGAPAVLAASADLDESVDLVALAELDRQAVTLAHSLSDERDEVVAYIAAGRDEQTGTGKRKRKVTEAKSARVDRQIDEIRAAAPNDLRHDLAGLPSIRRTALTGKGTALDAHRAYSDIITKLQDLADRLAERTPPRAAEAVRAPAALSHATEQASAERGLLLAALSVPRPDSTGSTHYDPVTGTYVTDTVQGSEDAERTRNALTAAAQQARVRELASLADFDQAATAAARGSLAAGVTGPEVKQAERYLGKLTDRPELSAAELNTDPAALEAALSARIEQMRGVESALATQRVERLTGLRDDDVTALETRIALLGGCLLVAVGISTFVARSLTRPLAVVRRGAARLADAAEPHREEPIRFTGRNDEFGQVVRSLNTLQGTYAALVARVERLDVDQAEQAGQAGALDSVVAELTAQRAELQSRTAVLVAELERLRGTVQHTFVNLSLRSLGLVERQLGVIEKLEEREQDPDRLGTLFKLDHMATVMRRHSENLLVLAGHEHHHGHPGPVPLVDVLRAAVSEIERYERVDIQSLPPHTQIAGFVADDLSHLVAELLENATSFSPPETHVQLSGWLLESGEVMLSVQDNGIGIAADRRDELNARLGDPEVAGADEEGEGLGIRVAALLAARHGVRVELREQKQGGTAAVVVLPLPLLAAAEPDAVPSTVAVGSPAARPAPLTLPGTVAEANSHTLPSRHRDPLIEAAERAIEESGSHPVVRPGQGTEPEAGTVPGTAPARTYDADAERDVDIDIDIDIDVDVDMGVDAAADIDLETLPDIETGLGADARQDVRHDGRRDGETTSPVTPSYGAESDAVAGHDVHPDETPARPGLPVRGARAAATEVPDTVDPEPTPTPGESVSETTLQVRLPVPPPAEEAAHERAPERAREGAVEQAHDQVREPAPAPARAPGSARVPAPESVPEPADEAGLAPASEDAVPGPREGAWDRVTEKGLPKRTPRIVRQPGPAAGNPRIRRGGVDAEALRRRLGGFQLGAANGRRDVAAEIRAGDTARTEETTGDTVEEARS
ncbi:integral membrane sensor signal transduction histidine kinase [Streptomyces laurentii]|uniref:histidine kinase n=1 Tax=Streptomyces laurentii TaxID=39478 RepID=A0A169P062_STRLU|nr:integral membrane sensor signal transduction histidine kinase [Streptomyces laurentii]